MFASEVDLAQRGRGNVRVDKKGKELRPDLRVDIDRHEWYILFTWTS